MIIFHNYLLSSRKIPSQFLKDFSDIMDICLLTLPFFIVIAADAISLTFVY